MLNDLLFTFEFLIEYFMVDIGRGAAVEGFEFVRSGWVREMVPLGSRTSK